MGHQLTMMYFCMFTVMKKICTEGHQDVLLCFYSDKQDLCQWNMANGDVDNTENLTIEKICLEFSPMRRRNACLLYTSPSPRDSGISRMPSSA